MASPDIEIVLTLVADEEIQQPVVTFQSGGNSIANQGSGITYNTADGGITWTATYKGHENDSEGGISFIIAFKDLLGILGVDVSAVTDASAVTFDKTTPDADVAEIASLNIK